MSKAQRYFWIVLLMIPWSLWVFICHIDRSFEAKRIGDQLKDKIIDFVASNQMELNYDGIDVLFSSMGCKRIHWDGTYRCEEGVFNIDASVFNDVKRASMNVVRGKTICQYYFSTTKGNTFPGEKFKCWQLPCLDLKQ